jgi:XRE family aerobic/anaerobic benzoate catabolism transcriptional regulator
VRNLRSERDLSRKMLAEAADVSERYLAQLESGSGNASVTLLRRVATALNVALTYLIACELSAERARVSRFVDSLPEPRLPALLSRMAAEFGAEESVRRKRIALIGLRGAGKSTLGSALAKEMRRRFVELDREIEMEAGMPLSEVFMLYNCFTVWIKALPTEHMARVIAQGDLRPMRGHSQAMEDLKELLVAREPQYARANAVVDTSGQTVAKSLSALRLVVAGKNHAEPG